MTKMFAGSENVKAFSINILFSFSSLFSHTINCKVILNAHNVDTLGNSKAPPGARGCPRRRPGIGLRGEVAAVPIPECSASHTDRGRPRNSYLEPRAYTGFFLGGTKRIL